MWRIGWLGVAVPLALHRKLGFVEEGRRRRAQFMVGRCHDEVLLGLTVEEFTAAHPLPGVGGWLVRPSRLRR